MKKIILLIILFSINFTFTFAHQPKLIKYSPSSNEPHDVIEPEISKAYYGKLSGEPHFYKIESDSEFSFYAGITIPKIDDKIKWISLEVFDQNNNLIFYEDGKKEIIFKNGVVRHIFPNGYTVVEFINQDIKQVTLIFC